MARPRPAWLYVLIAAVLIAAAVVLALRRQAPPGVTPMPTPSPGGGGVQQYKLFDIQPYEVLDDARSLRGGRRVLRRIIAVPPQAESEEVRATLLHAMHELVHEHAPTIDMAFIWAIPSPRLLLQRLLFTRLNILSGRVRYTADGKGLEGRGESGTAVAVTELPNAGPAPSRKELDLVIDATLALAKSPPGSDREVMTRVARERGTTLPRLQQAITRVLDHYPRLPPMELQPPG